MDPQLFLVPVGPPGSCKFVPVCLGCVGKLGKMVDPWSGNHLTNELRMTHYAG